MSRPARRGAGAVALLAAALVACATGAPRSAGEPAAGAAAASGFERVVRPFPVLDGEGAEYPHPFLGGLLAPRPQFADIDGDGDLDLFVQEYTGALMFFENVGGTGGAAYRWRSDRFQDLDIGEWYRIVDLDGDGLLDLLSEERVSYIRFWRNEGTAREPRWARADSLRDGEGRPIFMDRQNIPALVDLDCDGRLDLFVGRVEGIVAHYEAESPGSTRFAFLSEPWEGIEIVGTLGTVGGSPVPGGAPEGSGGPHQGDAPPGAAGADPAEDARRHGANALAFADFDGDGDADLFWGDFFEPGVLLIENVGRTCSSPSFAVEPLTLPYADGVGTSGYNAPVPVDLEGNGRLDFAMGVLGGAFNPTRTASDNFYFWERTAADRLELRTRRFLAGIDVGSESVPVVVDLDGDGRLDLVVGSKLDPRAPGAGKLFFFRNEGEPRAPRLVLADTLALVPETYNHAPAFADLDGDGVLDLLLGTWSGDLFWFRGERSGGVPRFVPDPERSFRLPRGSNAVPALGDLDGDGDLDLLVGRSDGALLLYRNEGTAREPRFVLAEERYGEISAGRRSAPALADVDGDGLLDLLVGREAGGVLLFRNAGTREAPLWRQDPDFSVPLPPMSAPALGDLDGDGVPDLLSGSISGGVVFWRGPGSPPRR